MQDNAYYKMKKLRTFKLEVRITKPFEKINISHVRWNNSKDFMQCIHSIITIEQKNRNKSKRYKDGQNVVKQKIDREAYKTKNIALTYMDYERIARKISEYSRVNIMDYTRRNKKEK